MSNQFSKNKLVKSPVMKNPITVTTEVNAPIEKVWEVWNTPIHIINWYTASPDWHTIEASNDLREGGQLSSRMEAKDGSAGFDFTGIYDRVKNHEHLAYTLADDRKVAVDFQAKGTMTSIVQNFEAENMNSRELQQQGWQSILDNFKKYTESL
jgi:uncharacterized protein YndB with AHSA1/START domain